MEKEVKNIRSIRIERVESIFLQPRESIRTPVKGKGNDLTSSGGKRSALHADMEVIR